MPFLILCLALLLSSTLHADPPTAPPSAHVREIRIQPNLTKMTSYGFTLTQLADAARGALSLRGAGFVDLAHQRVLIQTPVPAPDTSAISGAVLGAWASSPEAHSRPSRVAPSAGLTPAAPRGGA